MIASVRKDYITSEVALWYRQWIFIHVELSWHWKPICIDQAYALLYTITFCHTHPTLLVVPRAMIGEVIHWFQISLGVAEDHLDFRIFCWKSDWRWIPKVLTQLKATISYH